MNEWISFYHDGAGAYWNNGNKLCIGMTGMDVAYLGNRGNIGHREHKEAEDDIDTTLFCLVLDKGLRAEAIAARFKHTIKDGDVVDIKTPGRMEIRVRPDTDAALELTRAVLRDKPDK